MGSLIGLCGVSISARYGRGHRHQLLTSGRARVGGCIADNKCLPSQAPRWINDSRGREKTWDLREQSIRPMLPFTKIRDRFSNVATWCETKGIVLRDVV